MTAILSTTTASVAGAGMAVGGAGAFAVFGSAFLFGAGVALACTPAVFLAPGLIAAASVPVTTGEELNMPSAGGLSGDINHFDDSIEI